MGKGTVVKTSKIHGKGVFACRDFKKGEIVVKWDVTRLLTIEEFEKLPESKKKYVEHFNGKHILMQGPARYVNQSCNANTHAENFCDVASREIKKGEEITADYSKTMEKNSSMKCNCGCKNCRRLIKAD